VLPRYPIIPHARCSQNQRATSGKKDQKRRRKHEPGADGSDGRESCTDITVEGARLGVLTAMLEHLLDRLVTLGQGVSATAGTDHPHRFWGFDAVRAERTSAIGADGNGFGIV